MINITIQVKENCVGSYQALNSIVRRVCSGYAAILFTENPRIGFAFLLATFWFPNIGASGLIAILLAIGTARLLQFRSLANGSHLYNSLLIGLSIGASYQLDGYSLLLLFFAAISSVFFSVLFTEWFWRLEHLPALSLAFVLVAFITSFAAQGSVQLDYYLYPVPDYQTFLSRPIDYFLTALAGIFFTPEPKVGLVLFLGIFITSRYLALLTLAGFLAGNSVYGALTGEWYSTFSLHYGFNFFLTAMAIGGIFTLPSQQSFLCALFGAGLAAIIGSALQSALLPYGLTGMALPFLIVTLTLLAGLNKRTLSAAPYLLLENPALPEVSLERARLAKVRGLTSNCLSLAAPFIGEWTVYQGMNGEHTHQAPWQHALDFIMTDEQGKSYQTSGDFLTDYYCFGLPVLSPVYGQVSSCRDDLADHAIGEVDTENNWGNYVLIWVDGQHTVLLAHLQQHSLQVKPGDWLVVGQKIAQCGNTGRSPQPHIHLHVQQTSYLGSPTVDFNLNNGILRIAQQRQFYLTCQPTKNALLSSQLPDSKLAHALHFPLGKQLCYRFRKNEGHWQRHCFTVLLTLTGQFRLQGDSGASVAFVETDKLLAFYDRNPIEDACLDLLLLNLSMTPLVNGVLHWQDQPAVGLLPLYGLQKGLYQLLPFGHQLTAAYQRQWQEQLGGWQQQAVLEYGSYWHKKQTFHAQAVILPEQGCAKMQLQLDELCFEAELEGCGRAADIGIPGQQILSHQEEVV